MGGRAPRGGRLGWRARGGCKGAPPPASPEQPGRLSPPQGSLQGEFQRKLYKELVKNYNPLERPVANDSQPLTVYFSLSLLQIMDVVSPLRGRQGLRGRGSGGRPGGVAWTPTRPAGRGVPQSPRLPRRTQGGCFTPATCAPRSETPGESLPGQESARTRPHCAHLSPHPEPVSSKPFLDCSAVVPSSSYGEGLALGLVVVGSYARAGGEL